MTARPGPARSDAGRPDAGRPDAGRPDSGREPVDPDRAFSLTNPSRRVAIAAARVQVTVNDRLGKPTDPKVRELAEMPLAG